jgi:hypothetical protein
MEFWYANAANPKRIIMFLISGAFGIFADLIFYQRTLGAFTIRFFIIYALIGILVFEFLYRTRRWLNLITLAFYAILVVIASRWLYFIFIRIGSGAIEINDIYFNPFKNIYSLPPFVPSIFTTVMSYFLISFPSDFRFIRERSTSLFNRLSPKGNFAIGFFGWIIFHNLLFVLTINVAVPLFIALVFLGAVMLPIVLYIKKQNWVSTGIISAVIINAVLWIITTISSTSFSFWIVIFPFPIGAVLYSQ